MQVHGELKRAQLEILAADPSGAANLVLGRIFQNSSDSRVKIADGTKAKEFLLNDDKINIGTSVTLADNVRIHRAGVALLQFVTANDTTAEGALSTNTAKLSFQFESYTTAGRPANGKQGRIIFDTDLNVLLVDDGTNWVSTANGTEITNCAINLGTASNTNYLKVSSDTKANLDALTRKAGAIYYATDENKYYGDDGLNLVPIGAGGEGGINYTVNPNAETNADDHTAYKDAAQEIPEDGVGGSPTLSVARNTSNPLAGKASFVITKPASNVQGEGINIANEDFDEADKGKIHIMSFEYDASDANYNDGDFRVYFKDETNGVVYRVNGEDVKGGKGTHYARIQIPIDCDNGSLLIHCAATHTDAVSFKYDRVSFGPQRLVTGSILTDWEDFTPISSWNVSTTFSAQKRRVGDTINGQVHLIVGADGNSGAFEIDPPDGHLIDLNKIDATNNNVIIGYGQLLDAGVSRYQLQVVYLTSTNKIRVSYIITSGSNGVNSNVTDSAPINFATSDELDFTFSYPVIGWSSQSITSEDFGGRDIYVYANGNNGALITAGVTAFNWNNVIDDTSSSWGGAADEERFTAPEKGRYTFNGSVRITASSNSEIRAYKNGSNFEYVSRFSNNVTESFKYTVDLEKGDFIDFRPDVSVTLNNVASDHWIRISKEATSQQILETETVAMRATSDSGQSIGGTTGVFNYEDVDRDTHNAYDEVSGIYTVPSSGWYDIDATVQSQNTSWTQGGFLILDLYLDNVINSRGFQRSWASVSTTLGAQVSTNIYLNKGQQIKVEVFASTATNAQNVSSDNYFSIARIK